MANVDIWEPSPAWHLFLALLISVTVVSMIVFWRAARRRRAPTREPAIMESIARASDRLLAGQDPRSVVLRCYGEMMAVLSARDRIDPTCLTPREFADRLRQDGLSDTHVTELTAIFEIVRYGDQEAASFATRAAACLHSIREAHVAA